MTNGFSKTFDCLARTTNSHALDVLIVALDVPREEVRDHAVKAVLKRRNPRGHVELLRRFHILPDATRNMLEPYAGTMGKALRQCANSGEQQLESNALQFIREFEVYDQVPILLEFLAEQSQQEHHRYCLETVEELANTLYEHVNQTTKDNKYLRDARLIQLRIVSALEKICGQPHIPGFERLLESLFILGDLEVGEIRKMLRQDGHPRRKHAEDLLRSSDHPGIMQLVVDFMALSHPSYLSFRCLAERDDPQFICHLLRTWPRSLTISQRKNFKQIETVCWLEAQPLELELIPTELHAKLLQFVNATSIKREFKLHVAEWVVSHGCEEARRAATDMLDELDGGRMHTLIEEGLESDDEEVQAWATSQLRAKRVPEAFTKLIERLDSPMEQVQQAAREELEDFNLRRILTLYDLLDTQTCRLAGILIQKIDPDALQKLSQEMTGPMRSKRMRATQAAIAMGLQEPLSETFIQLLEDDDVLVRRTATEVVGQIPGEQSLTALQGMLDDSNPRIREIAQQGIERLQTTPAPDALAGE
ncbi:HEAT repeat domain-containing protein [Symmachiella macrocystis]|nr:HEAT repeat domain-containing protein [Symmachiella macrocystis]